MSATISISAGKREKDEQHARLSKTWATVGQASWLALTVIAVALVLVIASPLMHTFETVCTTSVCKDQQLGTAQARQLQTYGLTLADYAHYMFGVRAVFIGLYLVMAAIIVMRRPNDRMALFSAIFLVTFGGMTFPGTPATLAQYYPVWGIPTGLLGILGNATSVTFLYLFPTGRFVPRRAPVLIALWTAIQAPGALFPRSAFSFDVLPGSVAAVVFLIGLGIPLGAQIYRFVRVSDAAQRQQTKPVVFGLTLALGGFLSLLLLGVLVGPSTLTLGIVSDLIIQSAFYVFMLCVPVSIAVAVLRYRLWDVDALVNRTLVYVSLTASLVALYFGCVVGLQALFRAFTGVTSNLTIAISTLAIAAAFQPLRRRIQAGIDHRFYRRKYDAAQTLAAFTARLRDEVDLDHLSQEMASVVRETMQPVHVSLWLRQPDRDRR